MSQSDQSGPMQESSFEEFDVTAEPEIEAEAALESFGGMTDSEDEMRALLAAREELEKRLMPLAGGAEVALSAAEPYDPANVVGVGIGEKVAGGVPLGQLAVKVLVKEKKSESSVSSQALVPQTLGGVATDVEETGEIYASMFTARRRPAPGGVSIGSCSMQNFGTLGCLVTRNSQLFILSNNHVMALVNRGPLGVGICQPSRPDGGVCPRDVIARLSAFAPINFTPGAINLIDAAIARTSPALVDRRILRPGGALQHITPGVVAPMLGRAVQKSGRTTQWRQGVIDLINTTVAINYAPLGGVARFARQFRVRGAGGALFGDRGDSGSLVTTVRAIQSNQPVGLLFAVSAVQNMTFCNPIGTVLSYFGVTIVI